MGVVVIKFYTNHGISVFLRFVHSLLRKHRLGRPPIYYFFVRLFYFYFSLTQNSGIRSGVLCCKPKSACVCFVVQRDREQQRCRRYILDVGRLARFWQLTSSHPFLYFSSSLSVLNIQNGTFVRNIF
jgi:hypothetical protein